MEEEGDSPQFWLHSTSTRDSTRRISSSNFFNSTLLMLIVSIPALFLLLFAFSSFPSSTSQILKPNSVRKSWDSINVLLVLAAIFCGIFARWNEDVGSMNNKDLEIPVEEVLNEIPLQKTSSPTSTYELRWYELSHESQTHTTSTGSGRLRRSSSSYPDLRQQSDWETTSGHEFRYYDDFEISRFNHSLQVQPNGTVSVRGITRRNEDPGEKVIPVDTYLTHPDSAAKSMQDNPPSQPYHPPPIAQQKKARVHRSVPKRERPGIENASRAAPRQEPQQEDKNSSKPIKNGLTSQTKQRRRKVHRDVPVKDDTDPRSASEPSSNQIYPTSPRQKHLTIPKEDEYIKPKDEISSPRNLAKLSKAARKQEIEIINETQASQTPSPLSLTPTPIHPDQNQKTIKKDKKKSSARKEIAMVWASIYKRKKKQNQPQQQQLGRTDSGNYNGISQLFSEIEYEPEYTSSSQLFPPPPPSPIPPPPPPPPHSVFHSFFKKSGSSKSKKIHSVSAPPPPPPPPRQSISQTNNNLQPRISTSGKPPLPRRPSTYTKPEYGKYLNNSGSQSPLFDIPRPPPPPPFGVPVTKFVVRGDYAKIKSNASSRSGSPEPYVFDDDDELLISDSFNGEAARTTPYCPSPDVNAKADTFIARLRGEWRLEKMNSVNEKTTRMEI